MSAISSAGEIAVLDLRRFNEVGWTRYVALSEECNLGEQALTRASVLRLRVVVASCAAMLLELVWKVL
jgi:hypothetical protein